MWEAELSGHSPSPSLFIVKIAPQHCCIALVLYSAQWFQMAKNPPKHKFAQGDFTSFSVEVSANSHNFRFRFTFKIRQTVAGASIACLSDRTIISIC